MIVCYRVFLYELMFSKYANLMQLFLYLIEKFLFAVNSVNLFTDRPGQGALKVSILFRKVKNIMIIIVTDTYTGT